MGILICGLNGAGKSTLGKKLAERLSYTFIDNEDLYFPKTDEHYIFADPRSDEEVIHLLEERITADDRFVFAAVKGSYGDRLLSLLEYVIVIDVPREIRLERVRNRSRQKFGDRITDGGDLSDRENKWFSLVESRPEDLVSTWLTEANLTCPVIHIDGTQPVEKNVEFLLTQLRR
ncbi:MAG: AAA family ATPase [Lachnospiraceae bacterium]|nr:AAA family ATPase [Lachnospiraceae bacterium]